MFGATGNWLAYDRDNNGDQIWDLSQTRSHNKSNEITCLDSSHTNIAHDRNGNMTKMPKPNDWNAAFTCVYDAWNRLVQVKDGNTVTATYKYNGLNQRVKKTVGVTVTQSTFNHKWQELESKTETETTACVWGLRYIDDLICRDKGSERLFALQDANWNVVALCNTSGTVLERISYDAFGKPTWLDVNHGPKTTSGYAWNRTFTGQVYDPETGLMLYRNRFYHSGLGRFMRRDPIGYRSRDMNIYRYVSSNPLKFSDKLGLCDASTEGERFGATYKTVYTPGNEKPGTTEKMLDIAILLALLSEVPTPASKVDDLFINSPLFPTPTAWELAAELAKLKTFDAGLGITRGFASLWTMVQCYECKATTWFQCFRGKKHWDWKPVGKLQWVRCDITQTEYGKDRVGDNRGLFFDENTIAFRSLTTGEVENLRTQCEEQAMASCKK